MLHNVYLYDTLFAIFYLLIKRFAIAYFDVNPEGFERYRKSYYYFDFSIIMFGVIYMPQHNKPEAFVAFCFSLIIKFCFNEIAWINETIKKIVQSLSKDS